MDTSNEATSIINQGLISNSIASIAATLINEQKEKKR